MGLDIDIRTNLREVGRAIDLLSARQIPFAISQAINRVAARVQVAEKENIKKVFDRPTPFTVNSVGVSKANKVLPVADVFIKPIAARYLEPYETGGKKALNSKALLNPKNVPLNKYGNLSRNALSSLKTRPDVFIGKVKTSKGVIDGVWKRSVSIKAAKSMGKNGRKLSKANTSGRLKLLIRFGDALPTKQHLDFGGTAQGIVKKFLSQDFRAAMDYAIKTAK